MKLYTLWGQRPNRYYGEHAPELLTAWDEFCVDENPEGWEEAQKEAISAAGDGAFATTKVIVIEVNQDSVDHILNHPPALPGRDHVSEAIQLADTALSDPDTPNDVVRDALIDVRDVLMQVRKEETP